MMWHLAELDISVTLQALTVSERKAIAAAWVEAAKPYDLFVLVHVGSTCAADAIELASHAQAIGADASTRCAFLSEELHFCADSICALFAFVSSLAQLAAYHRTTNKRPTLSRWPLFWLPLPPRRLCCRFIFIICPP